MKQCKSVFTLTPTKKEVPKYSNDGTSEKLSFLRPLIELWLVLLVLSKFNLKLKLSIVWTHQWFLTSNWSFSCYRSWNCLNGNQKHVYCYLPLDFQLKFRKLTVFTYFEGESKRSLFPWQPYTKFNRVNYYIVSYELFLE